MSLNRAAATVNEEVMPKLPAGWVWSKVGEIGTYQNGRAFSDRDWGEVGRPIIRIQNLTGSGKSFNRFNGEVEEKHLVRAGDLLISWAATLGVFIWHGEEAALNQHIFKVTSFIDSSYHRYVLEWALDEMMRNTHGSGMVHITKGKFDATMIPLPPIPEQRRIVAELENRLSHVDQAISALESTKSKLKRLEVSLVQAAIEGRLEVPTSASDGDEEWSLPDLTNSRGAWREAPPVVAAVMPAAWRSLKLAEVALDAGYGTSVKTTESEESGIAVIRIPNVTASGVVASPLKYAPADAVAAELLLLPTDLLFIRSNGSRDVIGRSALAGDGVGLAFASYLIRFRLVHDQVLARWVALVTSSRKIRSHLAEVASNSAGQFNIGLGDIAGLTIPLPPRREAEAILEEVDRRRSLIHSATRSVDNGLRQAEQLRRSLLSAAVNGKLVPQDPSDDPAEELLKKIRADREARAGAPRAARPTQKTTARKATVRKKVNSK